MTHTEYLCYLAGLMDGEGCIAVYRRYWRGHYQNARVVDICGSRLRTLQEIKRRLKLGRIEEHKRQIGAAKKLGFKRHKRVYSWRVNARADIATVLRQVLPYLREKKPQALIMLREIRGILSTAQAARQLKAAKRK